MDSARRTRIPLSITGTMSVQPGPAVRVCIPKRSTMIRSSGATRRTDIATAAAITITMAAARMTGRLSKAIPSVGCDAQHGTVGIRRDPVTQRRLSTVVRRLVEMPDERAAIGFDDALRGDVVGIGSELDVIESARGHVLEDHRERERRVAALALPRHDRVADVAKARGRQVVRSVLPAEVDHSA